MFYCAKCTTHGCTTGNVETSMSCCPCKKDDIQAQARVLYDEEENHTIAHNAALVEAEGYGQLCRMEEIMLFAEKMGCHRIGLVFCMGLKNEAKVVDKILSENGFEVVSAICKNGAVPKSAIGLTGEQTLSGCADEVMCNPIGQALLMNAAETQLNILLGLCVGHDTLVIKYLKAPTTVLAVKDRVTGHNPLAPIYVADSYYKKRFFKEK